ncbi:MAG: hypothetical protein FWG03_03910 [Clostridiales bacterium]|nr:hypothetical protein [Clostridiales bacterium]
MIRRYAIVLAVIFLFALPLAAYADVIEGNEFFAKNWGKTVTLNRTFIVNGVDGYVSVRNQPGDEIENYRIDNGRIVRIADVYKHKGAYWGYPPSSHSSINGWFPMDELLMYYDKIDFANEHQDEFYDFNGSFYDLFVTDEFYIWEWPGADREKISYPNEYLKSDYLDPYCLNTDFAWMDGEGNEWIYLRIWGGYSDGLSRGDAADGWVCISDPGSDKIPAFNPAPQPAPWSPDDPDGWANASIPTDAFDDAYDYTLDDGNNGVNGGAKESGIPLSLLLAIIIIMAIGVGTVALILTLKRRKKARP